LSLLPADPLCLAFDPTHSGCTASCKPSRWPPTNRDNVRFSESGATPLGLPACPPARYPRSIIPARCRQCREARHDRRSSGAAAAARSPARSGRALPTPACRRTPGACRQCACRCSDRRARRVAVTRDRRPRTGSGTSTVSTSPPPNATALRVRPDSMSMSTSSTCPARQSADPWTCASGGTRCQYRRMKSEVIWPRRYGPARGSQALDACFHRRWTHDVATHDCRGRVQDHLAFDDPSLRSR